MSAGGIQQLLIDNNNRKDEFTPSSMFNDIKEKQQPNSVEQEKQRGFEQGYQEAMQKVEAQWDDKLTLLDNMTNELSHPLEIIDKTIKEKLVDLTIAIAKQIVRRELSVDSGQIVSAVKQAIDLIPKDGEKINLHINPKDMQYMSHIFSNEDSSSKYNIVQDPSIQVGGCKALTDYSLVDLTIDKQIASIAARSLWRSKKCR